MNKSILVTGANGQLGSEIHALFAEQKTPANWKFFFTGKADLDITDSEAVNNFCRANHIDTIINCAAYTAVDKAESDAVHADKINHLAVKNLAQTAKSQGIRLIHISTDYVFDGTNNKPYTEEDKTNPQGVYGKTKLDGENALISINPPDSLIIRTSWVYSSFGNNFVKTMLRLGKERSELGVVFDQVGSPTYAHDLATAIIAIIPNTNNTNTDVINYSNEGVCSWYDLTKAIFELVDIKCNVSAIETKDYPTPAQRPHFSVLNKYKIKSIYGIAIPYWKSSLMKCLDSIKANG